MVEIVDNNNSVTMAAEAAIVCNSLPVEQL
jgi:hypothetical protein